MNSLRITWIAFGLIGVCMVSSSSSAVEVNDNRAQDRQELLGLKVSVERAMSQDIATVGEHLAPDFSIVTFSGRKFDDFDVFVREWNRSREGYLQGGTFDVTLEPETTLFYGDIAVCRGDSKNVLVTGRGQRMEFGSPWTAVCRKVDGKWLIIRAHSSIDPFNNAFVRSNVVKFLVWVGAVTLTVGLVIGGLVMMLLKAKGA